MNSRLKQLMSINPKDMTSEIQKEFFKELKNSSFLLAIDSDSKPLKLNHNGTFVPIFTNMGEIEEFGAISFIRYDANDLVELLSLEEDIDNIVINPASDNPFRMNLEFFISNCKEDKFKQISELMDIVKSGVKPLDDISIFYLREQTPFMSNNIEDNIFTSPIPVCVSSNEDFNRYFPYLNKIYVPRNVLFAENNLNNLGDVVLAPIIKFKLIEKEGENTFVWQCVEQDLNIIR